MLSTHNTQRLIAQKTAYILLLATLLWIALLIFGASKANGVLGLYQVTFGPFVLNEITQVSTVQGRVVSLSFQSGLIWFFLYWGSVGFTYGWLSDWRRRKQALAQAAQANTLPRTRRRT